MQLKAVGRYVGNGFEGQLVEAADRSLGCVLVHAFASWLSDRISPCLHKNRSAVGGRGASRILSRAAPGRYVEQSSAAWILLHIEVEW